jgi:hypothetical protein
MTRGDESWQDMREGWERFGRAAEHFAQRVARDARRFAARVESHVGGFAHDLGREWRCAAGAARHGGRASADDVRQVFEELRGVLASVLDGVDELISSAFSAAQEERWTRIIVNREAACAGCSRAIGAGAEAWVRRTASGRTFRCLECGVPGEDPHAGARPA